MGPSSDTESNFRRWKASREPERWVRRHPQGWDRHDLLELLVSLRRTAYWPMTEAAIAWHLESLRDRSRRSQWSVSGQAFSPPSTPAPKPVAGAEAKFAPPAERVAASAGLRAAGPTCRKPLSFDPPTNAIRLLGPRNSSLENAPDRAFVVSPLPRWSWFDSPAPILVEEMLRAGALTEGQTEDEAVECLQELLAGKAGAGMTTEAVNLVQESLTYCLRRRANRRLNEAAQEWSGARSSVTRAIEEKLETISPEAWLCASMGTIPQSLRCPCMACGTVIVGRYDVLEWTFSEALGPMALIVCRACAERHRHEVGAVRAELKQTARQSAQDYAQALRLVKPGNPAPGHASPTRALPRYEPPGKVAPRRTFAAMGLVMIFLSSMGWVCSILLAASGGGWFGPLSVGFFPALIAVVVGHQVLARAQSTSGPTPRRLAIAGLVFGYVYTASGLIAELVYFAQP